MTLQRGRRAGIVARAVFGSAQGRIWSNSCGRRPDGAEIAKINARHLIGTPLKPVDLMFLFATGENVGQSVDGALRLWREGFLVDRQRRRDAGRNVFFANAGSSGPQWWRAASRLPRTHTDPVFRALALAEWDQIEPDKWPI